MTEAAENMTHRPISLAGQELDGDGGGQGTFLCPMEEDQLVGFEGGLRECCLVGGIWPWLLERLILQLMEVDG